METPNCPKRSEVNIVRGNFPSELNPKEVLEGKSFILEGKSGKNEENFKAESKSDQFKRSLEMFKSLSLETKQIGGSGQASKGVVNSSCKTGLEGKAAINQQEPRKCEPFNPIFTGGGKNAPP